MYYALDINGNIHAQSSLKSEVIRSLNEKSPGVPLLITRKLTKRPLLPYEIPVDSPDFKGVTAAWELWEDQLLMEEWDNRTAIEISRMITRTPKAIHKRISTLRDEGVYTDPQKKTKKTWTNQELKWLERNMDAMPVGKMCEKLDRSYPSVYSKIVVLRKQQMGIMQGGSYN